MLKIQTLLMDVRITPLNESKEGFNYTSAKLITENKVDFTHPGKITVRFRSPEGVGMWPAIWMMPSESIYGGWPARGNRSCRNTWR